MHGLEAPAADFCWECQDEFKKFLKNEYRAFAKGRKSKAVVNVQQARLPALTRHWSPAAREPRRTRSHGLKQVYNPLSVSRKAIFSCQPEPGDFSIRAEPKQRPLRKSCTSELVPRTGTTNDENGAGVDDGHRGRAVMRKAYYRFVNSLMVVALISIIGAAILTSDRSGKHSWLFEENPIGRWCITWGFATVLLLWDIGLLLCRQEYTTDCMQQYTEDCQSWRRFLERLPAPLARFLTLPSYDERVRRLWAMVTPGFVIVFAVLFILALLLAGI